MFVSSVKTDEGEQHKDAKKLIEKIYETPNPFKLFRFFTSKFSLIEIGEVIARKVNVLEAKSLQLDLLYHPEKRIRLSDPYKPDMRENGKSYFDIDKLVLELSYTGMEYQLPVFDTIHCHTILTARTKVVISSDKHFKKLEKLGIDLETPKSFLKKYLKQNSYLGVDW